jgi:methylphosphotriester-DNA--protein-cysteine methyltransferase
MMRHIDLGRDVNSRRAAVARLIRSKAIQFGGYSPAHARDKIYGTLSCASGRKMKVENRVFFQNEQEAINAGYRPCARCMHAAYLKWKNALF